MDFSLYLLTLLCLFPRSKATWCYQSQYSCDVQCIGPNTWQSQFPRCGGLRQSPINIVSSKLHPDSLLKPMEFIGHGDNINITVENKGQSVHFHLPQSVRLTGGNLPGHYRAAQFHFHWGAYGKAGSEHTIDGERFPMEMHVVHIKEPYISLTDAEQNTAGIALLAFLFEETTEDNPIFDKIITAMGHVKHTGNVTVIQNFRISDLLPPEEELHRYYRYMGSMTTPGCEQAVAWTVFHKRMTISTRQLVAMANQCQFWTGHAMIDIFRPTQPLDGRLVFLAHSGGERHNTDHWSSVALSTLGLMLMMY